MESQSQNCEGPLSNFVDLTSSEISSQNVDVTCPAQQSVSLGLSQLEATDIAMSSDRPPLFEPPPFTMDLFKDYVDDDDATLEEEPKATVLSSTQKPDNCTLLSGFTTPELTFAGTPSSEDTFSTAPSIQAEHKQSNRNGYELKYDDDDELGVFAPLAKRQKPFRTRSGPLFTQVRAPILTQEGRRLPKELRSGYRRGHQEIMMGLEPYQDFDYLPAPTSQRGPSHSYARVHTTGPATNVIPTVGGGYLVANAFMTRAQRKRIEQQESIKRALADMEECLAACPSDFKLRAKQLHLEELQRKLQNPEQGALGGLEASLIREAGKMLERRRLNMVTAQYESKAKALLLESKLSSSSSAGSKKRKHTYDEGIGSISPSSLHWGETAASGRSSSLSHPSTGGKTVPESYYEGLDRRHSTHDSDEDVAANNPQDYDDGEDIVYDSEQIRHNGQQRMEYGGKTLPRDNMVAYDGDDDKLARLLQLATKEEEGNEKHGIAAEEIRDDSSESSEEDEDDCEGGAEDKDDSDGVKQEENHDDEDRDGIEENDAGGGSDDEVSEDEDDEEQKETGGGQ